MKRGSLFVIILSLVFVLLLMQFVSAISCSPPGIFNTTDFCNIAGETEELRVDYEECLNDYECLHGSCVYGKITECLGTVTPSMNCPDISNDFVPGILDEDVCWSTGGCEWSITGCVNATSCSTWNKDQISCKEAGCDWDIATDESHYCEPEYKEIAAHTNFLQNMWIRIVLFFQGVFGGAAPETSREAGVGIPLPPNDLQGFYNDSTNIIRLNWSHPSVGADWYSYPAPAAFLPLILDIFPSVSAITGQVIGSGGITGYASQETITLYRCLGKTSFCEDRSWCDPWWDDICKEENGQCVPRSTCYQHPGTIYKSTCEGEGSKCKWQTAQVLPKEVWVVFERTQTKSCVLNEANRLEVCDLGAHTSHIGLFCDNTAADNYCKALGYGGFVSNSMKCDGRSHGEYIIKNPETGVETHKRSGAGQWILAMKCKHKTTYCINDKDCDDIDDDGDESGIVGDNTCEGGQTTNCDDNCLDDNNPSQSDADGDGEGDVCDDSYLGDLVCTEGQLDCTEISYNNCLTNLNCTKKQECTGSIDTGNLCSGIDSIIRPEGWEDDSDWGCTVNGGDCDGDTYWKPEDIFELCSDISGYNCVWDYGPSGYDRCEPAPDAPASVSCEDIYFLYSEYLSGYSDCGGCGGQSRCDIYSGVLSACGEVSSCIQNPNKEPYDCLDFGDGYKCAEYEYAGCTWEQTNCGNGVVDAEEECDGGDNCVSCECEEGYQSTTPPSIDCEVACPGEQCVTLRETQGADLIFDNGSIACQSVDLGCESLEIDLGNGWESSSVSCIESPPDNRSRAVCSLCGNGLPDTDEACDDGNNNPNDGCDEECVVEDGWTATCVPVTDDWGCDTNTKNTFTPIWGDGLVRGLEECDDGCGGDGCDTSDNDDGCDENCLIEDGWVCVTVEPEPSVCNVGTTNFTNYTIYRSPISAIAYLRQGMPIENSSYEKIAEIEITDATYCNSDGCEFNDTSWLKGGGNYYYIITSVTADGTESAPSNEISVSLPPCINITKPSVGSVCSSYDTNISCANAGCRWDGGDTTFPTINFETQGTTAATIGNAGLDQTYIEANVSVEDDFGIEEVTVYLYNTTEGVVSVTRKPETPSTSFSTTVNFTWLSSRIYYLNATVTDTSGNKNSTLETLRININIIDHEDPFIAFIPPTPETGKVFQNYIDTSVSATDNRGIRSGVISLYTFEGLHEEHIIPISTPPLTLSSTHRFSPLLVGTYYLNATVTDIRGNTNQTETRQINISDVPEGEEFPEVKFIQKPTEGVTYFPNSDMIVEISITDIVAQGTEEGLIWTLSSSVSGHITGGDVTLAKVSKTINLKEFSLVSVNKVDVHKITLNAIDRADLPSSTSFVIKIKNENCTDGHDNDYDGIIDGLDRDCGSAEGGVALSITGILAPNKADTYRNIGVDCKYQIDQDESSIMNCIELTLDGMKMSCDSRTIDRISNRTKFRNCNVGGEEKTDVKLKCSVSIKCNAKSSTDDALDFDVIKWGICEPKEMEAELLILNLLKPRGSNSPSFDSEEKIQIEVNVVNENAEKPEGSPLIVEAWLYDIDADEGNEKLASDVSEAIPIDFPGDETYELELTVPKTAVSEHQNRLYYKAYLEDEERNLCASDSISVTINSEGCTDADLDGYCVANDCNDTNADINPGVNETCTDDIDNDCDGLIDDDDADDCYLPPPDQTGIIEPGAEEDVGVLTSTGARRTMYINSTMEFEISDESHSATVKAISADSVTIEISSSPLEVNLSVGQTKDVDSDSDGTKDLRVKLNKILGAAADLTFKNIFRAPPTISGVCGDGTLNTGEECDDGNTKSGDGCSSTCRVEDEEDEEKGGSTFLIVLIVLIIGVVLLILLIYLGRKRKAGPGPSFHGPPRPGMPPRRPPHPPRRKPLLRKQLPRRPGPPMPMKRPVPRTPALRRPPLREPGSAGLR